MGLAWENAIRIILKNADKTGIPVSASFELTARCNFHCKMCYLCRFPDDKIALAQELTTEQWIRLGEEARNMGVFFVTITGGEIFLRKDFKQIYEAFSNMGFNITLHTNGSLITDEVADWLGKRPPAKVRITVYGASPETYKKITGHREGFDRTIKGITALTANGIHTEIQTTLIKGNQNEFDAMIALADKLGLRLGFVNYVGPKRDDICTDPIANRLGPMEAAQYEQKFQAYQYRKYLQRMGAAENTEMNKPEAADRSEQRSDCSGAQYGSAFKCTAGKCACWFTWDGKLLACGLLPEPALYVTGKPLNDQWNELKQMCRGIPKCKECEECDQIEFCMACPARLHSETGSFEKKAAYLCDTAKCRIDLGLTKKYQSR